MSRFKDFGEGKSVKEMEPLSFKLHGEEFYCLPAIQGKFLLDLVSAASEEDSNSAKMINDFFAHVLTDESLERFLALVDDKDRIVMVDTLSDIVSWLMGQYTNRPEEQPED